MYEIRMNGGKKMILDLIKFKLEFLRDRSKRKGIEKLHLELGSFVFCIEYKKSNSLYSIIMILHIPIRLDIRKINGFGI